jgi:hypothetical protein
MTTNPESGSDTTSKSNGDSFDHESKYFAAQPAEDAVPVLRRRADDWFETLTNNNYLDKIKRCWLAYHGAYFDDIGGGHSITFGGEQGELSHLPINHFRNLAQHILVMVTANRPSFQARSTNTDYKSLVQTNLANSLLEYYVREKRLEKNLRLAVEYAIVMGSGFIKMEWNATSGEIYDFNEDTQTPIYEGDVEFTNLSPYDVVFDSSKETTDLDWVVIRSWKNKFDIAAKYPELEKDIVGLQTKSDMTKFKLVGSSYDKTVDIPVYEFFHRRSESMPDGRYLLYLDDDIVLSDAPMPYRELPVYRIAPSDVLGTPYGYTSMFDLLPIQDSINSLYSTALTNQNAFGVQNIYVPRGADISFQQLAGGLNVIEGNADRGKPEPLNLTQTPPEIFNFMKQLEGTMETISGVSSVSRGNPEASVKSGTGLALLQSQSLEFMSGLSQQYVQLIEDIGTGLINMLKDFASVPRVAAIAGQNNKTEMKEFTGEDLDSVNRVIVDVGNALAQTTAGRVQIAEQLLQMMPEQMNPQQYINIMNTGKLEMMTSGVNDELLLIKSENERLVDGTKSVIALAIDNHQLHIMEHKNVLADSDVRSDPDLCKRALDHITDHLKLLRETDADLLVLMKQQPLGPKEGTPAAPPGPGQNPNAGGMGGPQATPSPEAAAQMGASGPVPQPAQPAQSPTGAPVLASEVPLGG